MKSDGILSLISRIREQGNRWLLERLKESGINELSPSHGDILSQLMRKGAMPMGEIATRIRRRKNTVTVLINKLITYGYVVKIPDQKDRRITLIEPTAKTIAFKKHFQKISSNLIQTIFKGFSPEEQQQVTDLLERIENNFK